MRGQGRQATHTYGKRTPVCDYAPDKHIVFQDIAGPHKSSDQHDTARRSTDAHELHIVAALAVTCSSLRVEV